MDSKLGGRDLLEERLDKTTVIINPKRIYVKPWNISIINNN
jgi:hypothetical protein